MEEGCAMNIYKALEDLVQYGLKKGLIEDWDVDYVRNDLLAILGLEEWKSVESSEVTDEISRQIFWHAFWIGLLIKANLSIIL